MHWIMRSARLVFADNCWLMRQVRWWAGQVKRLLPSRHTEKILTNESCHSSGNTKSYHPSVSLCEALSLDM